MNAVFSTREAIYQLFRSMTEGKVYLVTVPERQLYVMYENEHECDTDFGRPRGSEPLHLPRPLCSYSGHNTSEPFQFYGRFDGFGTRTQPISSSYAEASACSWTSPTSILPGMIFTVAKDTETVPFGTTVVLNRGQYQCGSYFAATFQPAAIHTIAYVISEPREEQALVEVSRVRDLPTTGFNKEQIELIRKNTKSYPCAHRWVRRRAFLDQSRVTFSYSQ